MADANAPDLYVPLMSFITFVLVTGYAKGSAAALNAGAGKFSPEVRVRGGVRQGGGGGVVDIRGDKTARRAMVAASLFYVL